MCKAKFEPLTGALLHVRLRAMNNIPESTASDNASQTALLWGTCAISMLAGSCIGGTMSGAVNTKRMAEKVEHEIAVEREAFHIGVELIRGDYKSRIMDVENSYTPCNDLQVDAIRAVRSWYFDTYPDLTHIFSLVCDSNIDPKCGLTAEEVFDVSEKMLMESMRTQYFCPAVDANETDGTRYGLTLRFADQERPGQMAIYPATFDEGGCELASTYVHELGHIATGVKHSDLGELDEQPDWIKRYGLNAYIQWQEDHGDSCD